MSNTFKPGDRVRRTTEHMSGLYPEGYEFTIDRISDSGSTLYEADSGGYGHNIHSVRLVSPPPAPQEFQVGDRVRATSKQGDDLAEFTVLHLDWDGSMTSERNYFGEGEWDFELLSRPEPPKPALPTKLGSVIRVTEFAGFPENYIGLLTSGGWMLHPDDKPYKSVSVFESFQPVFEVIYEPDN